MSSGWQALATQEAQDQGCPADIVLATVYAETSGNNITGDNGNALGFGQVWPAWHQDAFDYAARKYGYGTAPTSLSQLTSLVLNDDRVSMAATVYVIKQMWGSSGGNWSQFTYSYVGAGISSSDFQRRQNIWNQVHNSNFDYSGSAGDFSNAAFAGIGTGLVLPKTNFEIVKGSEKLGNVLYGRKYRVIVSSLDGEVALDVSGLKCTFDCIKIIQLQPQYSHIVIYNLSAQTENAIIKEGYRVVLEAGYESDQYGLIFDGNVVQAIRNKEGGTTYTLTLVAADSDVFLNYSLSAFSMVRGQNQREALAANLSKASIPTIVTGNISDSLSQSTLSRGKVVFGLTRDYIRQLAQSENATAYIESGKVNIVKATDIPPDEVIELSPASGLIGVPAQSDYGVTIKCLLNPKIKIGSMLHVDNSLINNEEFAQGNPLYSLDNDGLYRVIQLKHIGDTRGNDWYTECETVTQSGILPSLVANGSQSAF